jgi:hypothetical protein
VAGRSSSPLSPAGGKITNPQTKLVVMLAANGEGDLSGRSGRATRFCPSRSQTTRSRRSFPQRVCCLLFVIPARIWPLVCHSRRESAFVCHSRMESAFLYPAGNLFSFVIPAGNLHLLLSPQQWLNAERPTPKGGLFINNAGDHLISHTLARAVPSAQRGLTSVFGMGTGGTLAVNSPAN